MKKPLIECTDLTKWYSGVRALNRVNFSLMPDDVVGLIGDNGAGKSSLIKILSGIEQPTSGFISFKGEKTVIRSPSMARSLGIETIYQKDSTVDCMSIARNLFLGREPLVFKLGNFGWIDRKKMEHEAVKAMKNVALHLRSTNALVGELSGGQKQGVAIARAMYFKSKVVILDEPTNHISVKETEKVLDFVKGFEKQNLTGIFVSHNIHHVFECCTRIVVMARGEIIFDGPKETITLDHAISLL